MQGSFFAMLFRMKYINRWGLMHNTQPENLSQHTAECAFLAHFLAHVGNTFYQKRYNPDRLAAYALYHDASEVLTGDLPTPIKYYNKEMQSTYKQIEADAARKLLDFLPIELAVVYEPYLIQEDFSPDERLLLKAADRLCAYIKCVQETSNGNKEFAAAQAEIIRELEETASEETRYFLDHCLSFFLLSLHEMRIAL